MAGEDVVESFLEDDRERFAQSVEQGERRRVGEIAARVGLEHVPEVEEYARAARALPGGQRLRACAHDSEPGGQHEALL